MTRLFQLLRDFLMLRFIAPRWRLPCYLLFGMCWGLGLASVYLGRAGSYMSDSPETCVNCHVMNPQWSSWQHSAHANVATCNDCHVPHDNAFNKYFAKARAGTWHATVMTMRWEPQVIRMGERSIPIVEANCRRCHDQQVGEVSLAVHGQGDQRCWDCHRETPHSTARSLAADFNRPTLPAPLESIESITVGGRAPRPDDATRSKPHD
jgi:cytochrome c nitrite reductase small subunit